MRNKELIQDILEKLAEKENSNSKIEKNIENLMKNTNEVKLILHLEKIKPIELLQIKSNLENYKENDESNSKVIIPSFIFILSMCYGSIPLILNNTELNKLPVAASLFVFFILLFIVYIIYTVIRKSVIDKITSFNNNYKIVLYLVNFILENKKEEFKNNLKEDSNENKVEVKSKVNKNKKKQKKHQ